MGNKGILSRYNPLHSLHAKFPYCLLRTSKCLECVPVLQRERVKSASNRTCSALHSLHIRANRALMRIQHSSLTTGFQNVLCLRAVCAHAMHLKTYLLLASVFLDGCCKSVGRCFSGCSEFWSGWRWFRPEAHRGGPAAAGGPCMAFRETLGLGFAF